LNTRYLIDTNAAISDTYLYDAYGVTVATSGTTTNFYRYSGEQLDPNLGLYYLRARYMNPDTGRFWTRDSFGGDQEDPKSLHRYTYGEGDPVDNVDPSGHDILGIINILASLSSTVSSKTTSATVKKPLSDRPKGQAQRLFAAVIFSESTAGDEDAVEKLAIGATVYNDAFYAKLPPKSKQKKNYNAPSFGDGTILGAIKTAFPKSYKKARWNLVALAADLKSQADIDQALIGADREHYNLCIDAANAVTPPPMGIKDFKNEAPVGFNKADDKPPSDREHKIGHAGSTTFYGFDTGREYE
jgi:RHS repeat-associated protein